MKHHGGSRDLDPSVGGLDILCTSLNSSHSLALLILPPAELGGRERERLLGLSSISPIFVTLSLVAWKKDFVRVGLGSRTPRLRFRGGNLVRTGLLSPAAKEDWVRVGLGSRVLGRGALSDRGPLVRRLVIPVRVPKGVDSTDIDRLGPASDESVADPFPRVVRRGNTILDGAEPEAGGGRGDGIVRRGVEVGRRRYRARLHTVFRSHFWILLKRVYSRDSFKGNFRPICLQPISQRFA
jgi:hypothetical protein